MSEWVSELGNERMDEVIYEGGNIWTKRWFNGWMNELIIDGVTQAEMNLFTN